MALTPAIPAEAPPVSLRPRLTVGVTGHRDLIDEEIPALRERARGFLEDLARRFSGLDLEVICGLAEGADQLVAEVALELGIPLIGVLPFEEAEYERDFSGDALARLGDLRRRCQLIVLPRLEAVDDGALREPGQARDRHYAQVGVFISNHCQVLLAFWDGRPARLVGGTASVLEYHLTGLMPGVEVEQESPNLLADNENDLAFHLACSRAGSGAPEGLEPLQGAWLSGRYGRGEPGEGMPRDYRQMFGRLAAFGDDLHKYRDDIHREARGLLADAPDLPRPPGIDFIDRTYALADWAAVHFQKRFFLGLVSSHLLAVAMGGVFIVYSEMLDRPWLAGLFLALFATGLLLHLIGEKREWHRKYLDYRALAEGLRVQTYWALAGVVDARAAEFAYDNFLQKQDVDLAWIRHVMRSASLRRQRGVEPDPGWVPWVIDQWVGTAEGGGQLAYYASKARTRAETYRRTVLLGGIALWTGILMAVFLGLFADRLTDGPILLLLILMGLLPLMAGVRDAYSHKKADKELIRQYRFMERIFANARRLLDGSDDLALQRRVLRAVGSAALEEHAEWLLMHRERPLEPGGLA